MKSDIVPFFATSVVDIGGVVVHLDLRISSQIFEKIWNGPNGILWGWGEIGSWKKQKIIITKAVKIIAHVEISASPEKL